MKVIFTVCILALSFSIYGQSYFSKIYDPFGHASEDISTLGYANNQLQLFGRGSCDFFTKECHKLVIVNRMGELASASAFPNFESGYTVVEESKHYFVGGGNEPISSKMRLLKLSYNGDSLGYIEFVLPNSDYTYYLDRGIVEFNDQILLYGQIVDTLNRTPEGKEQTDGLIVWINKNMTIDTFTIFHPPLHWMIYDDFLIDNDGNLCIVYEYKDSVDGFGRIKPRFKAITKLNTEKDTILHWVSPWYIGNYGSMDVTILDNDNLVFDFIDEQEFTQKILCISPQGETVWEYEFEHNFEKKVYVYNLKTTESGDIIGCGMQESAFHPYGQTGFFFKLSADGELIWERILLVDVDQHPQNPEGWPKRSWLNDVIELPNGDMAAGGRIYSFYDDPMLGPRDDIDMWLVKTDPDGCILPDCGLEQLLTKTNETVEVESVFLISPNPTTNLLNIKGPTFDSYEIHNLNGQILQAGPATSEIDISTLPVGLYLLKIQIEEQFLTHKIIKI